MYYINKNSNIIYNYQSSEGGGGVFTLKSIKRSQCN